MGLTFFQFCAMVYLEVERTNSPESYNGSTVAL